MAEGTYLLTKWEVYSPATPGSTLRRQTLRRTGNQVDFAGGSGSAGVSSSLSYSVSSAGGWTVTCGGPIGAALVQNYTATPTTFQIFYVDSNLHMTAVETFTLQ